MADPGVIEQPLVVSGLSTSYRIGGRRVTAVHDVDLAIGRGEIVGVVGESGCGKSTLAAAILDLMGTGGRIDDGRVEVGGRVLTAMGREEVRQLRGPGAAMIFQDPFSSLNPAFTIGKQLDLVQRAHADTQQGQAERKRTAVDALTDVGLPDPASILRSYPHQLSGGQRQRVMIAVAMLLRPWLLIADEPTSALDVTTEAQIIELLRGLRDEHGTGVMFVSHDLGSVAQICDRVIIMYAGRVVEQAPVRELFHHPRHPYTRALLSTVPSWRDDPDELPTIPGAPPALTDPLPGCRFEPRCPHARPECRDGEPGLLSVGDDVEVRCVLFDESITGGSHG